MIRASKLSKRGSAVRRVSRVLISAAGALLIAPLVVAAQALPANAATGKLLVTTIARSGHSVTAPITIATASSTSSALPIWTSSGRTLSLADGQYYVLAGIQDAASETLAAALVTVSGTGTARVTLDARQGHQVKVTLDGKAVSGEVDARICAQSGYAQSEVVGAPGTVFVVPSTSRALSFAYLAQGLTGGQGATVSGLTSSGIPASPGGAWTTSRLAKVSLTVRGAETPAATTSYEVQAQSPAGPNDCQWDIMGLVTQAAAPYTATELVSPGYWDLRTDDTAQQGGWLGGYDIMRHVLAARSYSYTYYSAAWGVGGPDTIGDHLPMAGNGSISLIAPRITDAGGNGTEEDSRSAVALSLSGHQIAKGTVTYGGAGVFRAAIKSAGWYTLTDNVTRDFSSYPGLQVPAGLLTSQVTLSWRFYATPALGQVVPAFWTSFIPAGLNTMNQAKPASSTTVTVTPIRSASDPNAPVAADSVTRLQVWSSVDGVHWTALAVSHTSSGWSVLVKNPAMGTISLRATVTGSHGDTSTETISRAYAIS
jgi:hypothetical protein